MSYCKLWEEVFKKKKGINENKERNKGLTKGIQLIKSWNTYK
jgi:hypothetical protein